MKKALWARIGVSFNVSDEEYETLAQAEGNNKKSKRYLKLSFQKGKPSLTGIAIFRMDSIHLDQESMSLNFFH